MCNLEYIARIRWRNRQYWEHRNYIKQSKIHLENLERHLYNTVKIHSEIEYFRYTPEIIENYLVYLEREIENTKRNIRGSINILKYYEKIAKIETSIG